MKDIDYLYNVTFIKYENTRLKREYNNDINFDYSDCHILYLKAKE